MDSSQNNSSFPVTRWTAVLKVHRQDDTRSARQALEDLCKTYWYPVYAFARRLGHSPHDAQDLTQGFFSYVVDRGLFATANPELGRLRTFLLTTFRRYVCNVKDYEHALKRGGHREILSLDVEYGEEQYAGEPADTSTPESLFERSWALSVLRCVYEDLGKAEATAGRAAQFEALAPFLSPDGGAEEPYSVLAERLAMTEDSIRQTVSRLRKKFRLHLRDRIADTLSDPTESQIDAELVALREALRG